MAAAQQFRLQPEDAVTFASRADAEVRVSMHQASTSARSARGAASQTKRDQCVARWINFFTVFQ
ncbi:MAG TPA: hypothetical protein VIR54_05635, partial [Vicinamibacterales bacterium]